MITHQGSRRVIVSSGGERHALYNQHENRRTTKVVVDGKTGTERGD